MANLGVAERKCLGALVLSSCNDMTVKISTHELANKMGYKKTGGTITYALQMLEMKNYIVKIGEGEYKVLL